jgi:hypothetical protein
MPSHFTTHANPYTTMKLLQILSPRRRRLLFVASVLLSLWPQLSAQTTKELVADACYNERQQRKQEPFWASRLLRRSGGHVYLEKEIETAAGPVHRLLLVDGHQPSPSDRKQEDDRLRKLRNPSAQESLKRAREADEKKVDDVLDVIPDVLLFQDQGRQGNLEKLAFSPNPEYEPKSREEMVLHAMSGVAWVDLQDKCLAQISATLTQQVEFGHGLIGSLKQGGTVEIQRTRISPGLWKTSSIKIDINGRIILFKTISEQQDETRSDFQPVAADTSVEQAVAKLADN